MSSGILAIGAAVPAGIGVDAMVGRMAPPGLCGHEPGLALTELPGRDVVLYTAQRDRQLRTLTDALIEVFNDRSQSK